ncbi:MAG: nuclear transport factor 2 family protein [Tabrizicola sp.]|uniref:nuclear transport factor 2 family protein n=1 Tax=Tabrizicola sp. TaxID=2005166 RepID=UPI002ABC2B87|nr:nuclear transport factor 2 family protein [Tabrizicola sp.]MDZ4086595.1 nuclear transport factor 2 family protein [Tabrizicola sp.]
MMLDAQTEISQMLDTWAASVRAHDLEGAVRGRNADVVMFDVPEPLQAKGIDAYRDTWRLYFRDEGSRRFELLETRIVAGEDVAWVHALLRCTTDDAPAGRLTMGLRRVDGRWIVEHEHHSFPVPLTLP